MMLYLQKLSHSDGKDVFDMLKEIKPIENSFTNPANGMTFQEYQDWLLQQEQWDRGEMLPKGYVAQSIYWLYDDSYPVGIGKIRHELTDVSRENGGNIGYAIRQSQRGKGYGVVLLKLLLMEARKIGVNEILLTIDKKNEASKIVCEKNGGVCFDKNSKRWFYKF